MKIYLDCCCFNRPFDDQGQDKIRDEADAILSIMARCQRAGTVIQGSAVLRMEIARIPNREKRLKAQMLYAATSDDVPCTASVIARAKEMQSLANIATVDSLHLASAEAGGVDVFLSTDAVLLRRSQRLQLPMRTMNPVSYLAEVIEHDDDDD